MALKCNLFLGFERTTAFERGMKAANPYLLALLVHGEEEQREKSYLTSLIHNDRPWIGKYVDAPLETEQIELLQANIYSLARKLVPGFSPQSAPLYLFSLARSLDVSP